MTRAPSRKVVVAARTAVDEPWSEAVQELARVAHERRARKKNGGAAVLGLVSRRRDAA